ncbi:DNA-binding response regulator [Geomonas limicola]|uniref:DNA-binding response regulator n=1 Tax=Geomonas limicola TaxID=2740186 RepID=A0A6V8N3R1_9BACT|nr:response regulator transcription factor [Geomonas limicola]GFO67182.1 DNA-binding response regulator [Geomonas limicola]
MSIEIIIADDHLILREGLKALLASESDIRVVAEADNGAEAIDLVRTLRPRVLVVDITMEGMNGLEVTRRVSQSSSGVSVIILSMHDDKHYVAEALRAGAKGFVLKSAACAELVGAIRAAAANKRYLSPSLYGVLIPLVDTPAPPALSRREQQVLVALAEGKCIKEIAFALNIGTKTVETYRHNLMKKLNLANLAELTKYAIRSGLVSLS